MHKIFVWSIQHTGTFFASHTISAAYPGKRQLRIGSIYERHKNLGHKRFTETGPIELSDFVEPTDKVKEDWFDQAITTVCTPEELAGKRIIVGHEHHHKANSWMIQSVTKFRPGLPIIVPMRDPILSLHSKLWRAKEQHHNEDWNKKGTRETRLKDWIRRYIEFLSVPEGHIFILPIDAEQSKEESSRVKIIKELYSHCGVPFNDLALEAILKWAPENRTHELITKTQDEAPSPRWERFKERYLAGDIEHTKKLMRFEFEELHKRDDLKRLMEKIGYKDVLWW